jgi:hypothetical protein
MKKILITLTALVSFVFANDATLRSMHIMESGLNDIQRGFLYNQKDLITDGAKRIKNADKIFSNPALTQKYLPSHKKHMIGVTMNQARRITAATTDLIAYIKSGEMGKASHAYSDVIDACSACHSIVRGW